MSMRIAGLRGAPYRYPVEHIRNTKGRKWTTQLKSYILKIISARILGIILSGSGTGRRFAHTVLFKPWGVLPRVTVVCFCKTMSTG